ncbi:MAG: hypothetical protein K9I85_13040 [Saprospiraceae bacterium]|nr:hypothetical protein [Saprospiraceae bacterium]
MNIWSYLFFLLLFIACDKAPTKPFHDLSGYVGEYAGAYRELGCGDPPFVEYAHDSVLTEISVVADDVLGLRLFIDQGSDLWDLEAFYINDTTFYITPFTKDQQTWTGNLRLSDDLNLILANRTMPCVILGDTVGTVIYMGSK